jgi:hypothetical protein
MTKQAIIDEIESRTSPKYGSWRIGLTNNPDQQRRECDRADFWMDFETDSPAEAKEIESRYVNRGMQQVSAGALLPGKDVFVFIL